MYVCLSSVAVIDLERPRYVGDGRVNFCIVVSSPSSPNIRCPVSSAILIIVIICDGMYIPYPLLNIGLHA